MNNTQSLQVIKLLNCLSEIDRSDFKLIGSNLAAIVDKKRRQSSQQRKANTEWEGTQSEWDFINVINGISDLLKEPNEGLSEQLSLLSDRIVDRRPPLKIVFFVQEYSLWASFRTIYEYYLSLNNCTIDLVYVYSTNSLSEKEKERNIKLFKADGYRVLEMEDYDLTIESPDVAFYLKPYKGFNGAPPKFYIEEISKHIRYTVFVSYCLDVQGGEDLVKFFYAQPMLFHAWKVISYSSYYTSRLKRYSYRDADNIVEMGHPKFDGISAIMEQGAFRIPEWDAKISNRPVVLWNTHFSVKSGEGVGTFFDNKDTVFDFFKSNTDKVLLWRPHPYFWSCIEEDPRIGKDGLEDLLEEVGKMGNVIIDTQGDYRYSFAAADALLSDATTFLVEYAMTGKPVMYTPKKGGESVINEAYLKEIEICSDVASLHGFLDRVGLSDGNNEQRKLYYEKEFGVCDGQNGKRIGEYICNAIDQDCEDFVRNCLLRVM